MKFKIGQKVWVAIIAGSDAHRNGASGVHAAIVVDHATPEQLALYGPFGKYRISCETLNFPGVHSIYSGDENTWPRDDEGDDLTCDRDQLNKIVPWENSIWKPSTTKA